MAASRWRHANQRHRGWAGPELAWVPMWTRTLAASGWYARVDGKGWTNFPLHA